MRGRIVCRFIFFSWDTVEGVLLVVVYSLGRVCQDLQVMYPGSAWITQLGKNKV